MLQVLGMHTGIYRLQLSVLLLSLLRDFHKANNQSHKEKETQSGFPTYTVWTQPLQLHLLLRIDKTSSLHSLVSTNPKFQQVQLTLVLMITIFITVLIA